MKLAIFLDDDVTGMTLTAFAALVGRDRTTVGRWVDETTMPSVDAIARIEQITGGRVTFRDFADARAAKRTSLEESAAR